MGKNWEYGSEYVLAEPIAIEGRQAFLLCSDGFWEHIVEVKMQQLLHEAATPEEWLRCMADEVRRNGAEYDMDNYSAVAVWIDSTR
jgi:serine/threonine protein phosphatase PrpC